MKLKLVQMITRHGERTPQVSLLNLSASDNWTCDSEDAISGYVDAAPETHYRTYTTVLDKRFNDFKPNCRAGDLTVTGMEQHFELGKSARKHFIDDLHFLPENMDPKYFKFISSPFDRCFKSAQSFLTGFYEPKSDNEVLNIETGTDVLSSLFPNPGFCKEIKEQKEAFNALPETEKYLNQTWEKVADMASQLGLKKSNDNILSMCDWAVTYGCAQDKVPAFLTDDVFDTCRKVVGYYHFKYFELNPNVPISYTLRHMYQISDNIIGQSQPTRFVLISAHDSTITALLVFLGIDDEAVPPFASNMCMELWSEEETNELYVRFALNGKPVTIKEFNSDVVKFDEFRVWSDPKIQHCLDVPI
jgi:acid phosphatase